MSAFLMQRASLTPTAGGRWGVVETTKRPWRISAGDLFLFMTGYGDELDFALAARVLGMDRERTEVPTGDHRTSAFVQTVHLSEPLRLPEDRTLNNLMFSLERVYNFQRPYLHFRHRSKLRDADLETILTGRIHTRRSVYYGLLRQLPKDWRSYLEHASLARAAVAGRLDDPEESPPVAHLLQLLEQTVFQSVSLAASIQELRQEIAVGGLQKKIVAGAGDDSVPDLPVEGLLQRALILQQHIDRGRQIIDLLQEGPVWSRDSDQVELPAEPELEEVADRLPSPSYVAEPTLPERTKSAWQRHRW